MAGGHRTQTRYTYTATGEEEQEVVMISVSLLLQLLEEEDGGSPAQYTTTWSSFFSFEYYQSFFDVTTSEVSVALTTPSPAHPLPHGRCCIEC